VRIRVKFKKEYDAVWLKSVIYAMEPLKGLQSIMRLYL
jgi:hypothetical protein